jgi:inorganic phosphate transporter, PiT family
VTVLTVLTLVAVAALAYANGANDVSKGVATLAGTGRASYRAALAWGTTWTFVGALASLVLAVGFVKAFTTGLVVADVIGVPSFALAAASGGAAWVLLASRTGLPVSTTHALTGAIVGVALMVGGLGAVKWPVLVAAIAAPLALSPLVAGVIGYGVQGLSARYSAACVCVSHGTTVGWQSGSDGTLIATPASIVRVAAHGCEAADTGSRWLPAASLHWGAAAALSFARGVNDNAKIAALASLTLTGALADLWVAFGVTAVAMTLGSHLGGLRVTRTLGERVVHMEQTTGLAAAMVAALLVLAASLYTLPVSTTQVSTGAIVGAGLRQNARALEWTQLGRIATAWVVTLPVSAAVAAVVMWTVATWS